MNNTLILPSNVGDISSFVAQALSVYKSVSGQNIESITTTTTNSGSSNSTSTSSSSSIRNESLPPPISSLDYDRDMSADANPPDVIVSRKLSSSGGSGGGGGGGAPSFRGSAKNIE